MLINWIRENDIVLNDYQVPIHIDLSMMNIVRWRIGISITTDDASLTAIGEIEEND